MGSVAKFNYKGAYAHLRYILREVENPTNIDIDESRTHLKKQLEERELDHYYADSYEQAAQITKDIDGIKKS